MPVKTRRVSLALVGVPAALLLATACNSSPTAPTPTVSTPVSTAPVTTPLAPPAPAPAPVTTTATVTPTTKSGGSGSAGGSGSGGAPRVTEKGPSATTSAGVSASVEPRTTVPAPY